MLNRFLVDEETMLSINGISHRWDCSEDCLDEEGNNYQFKDTARFTLANCVHFSPHLQCIISLFIIGEGWGLTNCPIKDSPQCRGKYDYTLLKYGVAYYWGPEDYYNFAKAFFRSRALTEVFLKPEFR